MKTNEFETIYDLKKRIFGKTSGTICHYTSFESLVMILKYRSFRLTRYDLMNDFAEKNLSRCSDGDCRYIISFSGATSENIAMWALYGKNSSLKLRLEFGRGALLNTVEDQFFFDSLCVNKIPKWDTRTIQSDFSKKSYTLSEVVYYSKQKNSLRLSGSPLKNISVTQSDIDDLAGTIKYDAWEFEKEIRLSTILHQNYVELENPTHIYVKLNDDFIRKLTITYSPWIDKDVFEELKSSIDSLAGYPLLHKNSSLYGEVAEL